MGDLMSLSVLQVLSVLSLLTSLFAVVRVGAGSLHRFSHKFEANLNRPPSEMNIADGKAPLWNWNLGGSFSLGSLIGEDEEEEVGRNAGYTGGSDLMRMDWQVSRPVTGTSPHRHHRVPQTSQRSPLPPLLTVQIPPQFSQPPISMAKLIMSRHVCVLAKAYRGQRWNPVANACLLSCIHSQYGNLTDNHDGRLVNQDQRLHHASCRPLRNIATVSCMKSFVYPRTSFYDQLHAHVLSLRNSRQTYSRTSIIYFPQSLRRSRWGLFVFFCSDLEH